MTRVNRVNTVNSVNTVHGDGDRLLSVTRLYRTG
jgi:hypothetical protein